MEDSLLESKEQLGDWMKDEEDRKEHCRYLQESIQLLSIFPEEVWTAIFDLVEDPNDLESLSNASLYFRKVLFEYRVVYLFPKVLILLGDRLLNSLKRDDEFLKEAPWATIRAPNCISCGRRRKQRWFSGLLGFRLVCSLWCSGVDQWTREDHVLNPDSNKFLWADSEFYSQTGIQQFREHFYETHGSIIGNRRSPFVSGCVRLEYGSVDCQERWQFSTLLLNPYGQHILCFSLQDHSFQPRPFRNHYYGSNAPRKTRGYYPEIRQFLEMMPRLRRFDYFIDAQFSEKVEDLMEEISLHPLPQIPSLECLRTNLPMEILNELIRSNSQITRLDVERQEEKEYTSLFSMQSIKLKEFHVQFNSMLELDMLEHVNWPLKKLKLKCGGGYFEWSKVFCVLGNKAWTDTLVDLTVHFPMDCENMAAHDGNRILRESLELRLQLPRLKRLEMRMDHIMCSLDFLLPLRDTLENLKVGMNLCEGNLDSELVALVSRQQLIQFVGYSDKLYESNIWKLFPKLELFKLNRKEYSRLSYSHRKKRNVATLYESAQVPSDFNNGDLSAGKCNGCCVLL